MGRIGGTGARLTLVVVAIGVAVLLSGCVPGAPTPEPTIAEGATGSPAPSSTPEPPHELDLAGTAEDNRLYFADVNKATIKSGNRDGRSFIDNLVKAGFPKEAMEVTPDRTTVNADVDQLFFSVRINGTCLIGQYGGGKYKTSTGPLLADGKCLIGNTRDIDW
jgi:hypothetical protein